MSLVVEGTSIRARSLSKGFGTRSGAGGPQGTHHQALTKIHSKFAIFMYFVIPG